MTHRLWMIAALALLAGTAVSVLYNSSPDKDDTGSVSLEQLELPDLNGNRQSFRQWKGKVVLVNFWATWCPPCIEEMPMFLELRNQYSSAGFEIVGIAVDEIEKAREFGKSMQIDYPLMFGLDDGMSLMASLGNRLGGLPYSVLFDRSGNPVNTKTGPYSKQELEDLIKSLL